LSIDSSIEIRVDKDDMYALDIGRLLSSSSLMMHAAPVLLHWAHSDSPSLTTHRILLSRHEAQAIEARWRTCCLLDERAEGAGLDECSSESALSLSPSERDLRFPPANAAAAMIVEDMCQLLVVTQAGNALVIYAGYVF